MMDPAKLFEAVAFDAPTESNDGYGGRVSGWTEQFTTRANFLFLRGGETVQAARLQGRQPVVATVRASSDSAAITPAWRMRDTRSGVAYNIRAIVRTDDRMYYEITAESGLPQ